MHVCVCVLTRSWIFDGELRDECEEFFVGMDPTVPDDRLWQDKYTLNRTMVPKFIGAIPSCVCACVRVFFVRLCPGVLVGCKL